MRRVAYGLAGIVTVNLTAMAAMWIQQPDEACDVESRGLAVQVEGRWTLVQPAGDGTDPAPCRGEMREELHVLPD